MSTEESWTLTPREFHAREKVRKEYMSLWLVETRNAPHFRREDEKPYTLQNIFQTAKDSALEELQKLKDNMAMVKARMELSQIRTMDRSLLPSWGGGLPKEGGTQ